MEVTNPLIEIRCSRNRFARSRDRLQRARRLYVRIIRCRIAVDPSEKTLKLVAERAQAAGIYSPKNARRDVMCSILRRLWKWDVAGGSKLEWGDWCRKNYWSIYPQVSRITCHRPDPVKGMTLREFWTLQEKLPREQFEKVLRERGL